MDNNFNYGQNNGQPNDHSQNGYGQTTDYSQNGYGQNNGFAQTNNYAQNNNFGQNNTVGGLGSSGLGNTTVYGQDNVVMGIIGALIGTALGVIVWILIAKLGYISWIGGFAIAAGAFYGYFLMGKGMSGSGIAVSVVLVIFAVWFATKMSWALELQKAFKEELDTDYSLGECWKNMSGWLKLTATTGSYIRDLVLGYVFTALGAFSVFKKFKG